MPSYRLGDDVDDFCIKCKRITNHSIVSVLNEEPAKVRCRTCYNDHDFRRCEIPPSKKDLKKAALLQEVLAAGGPAAAAAATAADPRPEEGPAPAAGTADTDTDTDTDSTEGEEEPAADADPTKARKGGRKTKGAN
jgi:hypothetical protein